MASSSPKRSVNVLKISFDFGRASRLAFRFSRMVGRAPVREVDDVLRPRWGLSHANPHRKRLPVFNPVPRCASRGRCLAASPRGRVCRPVAVPDTLALAQEALGEAHHLFGENDTPQSYTPGGLALPTPVRLRTRALDRERSAWPRTVPSSSPDGLQGVASISYVAGIHMSKLASIAAVRFIE
jgi:hypothetical protein